MDSARRRSRLTPFGKAMGVLVLAAAVVAVVRWPRAAETERTAGPPLAAPGSPPSASPSPPVPGCIYGDDPVEHAAYDEWDRTLLDTRLRLPMTYRPPDLVAVSNAGFDSDVRVRSFLIPDLGALREAAAAAGNPVEVLAAYRSFGQQRSLFEERQEELGYDRSLDRTARAGHSEHQLGTAVDFKTLGAADVTQAWGSEPAGAWMARNAHRFGFVLSYPERRRKETCYPFEPWHFRYVGRGRAAAVRDSGLTLREYLWRLDHP